MANIATLIGEESASIRIPPTQVYQATHDGKGNRLSYRYRSFISFKFDNEWIEDFNFIAYVDGDRMQKNLTAEFEDLTSSYDVLDGQFYHSTHFRTNTIHFSLVSDEIDGRLMEKFRNHFSPGKTAELVLSEYPNRAIMARLASPPEMAMLPFEKEIQLNIGGIEYTTSVTNYKGTVELEFVMDDPFWYSIINIFGKVFTENDQNTYVSEWDGVEDLFASNDVAKDKLKDVLKIVYEDGIPMYHMLACPMLFGNDVYAASGDRLSSKIAIEIQQEEYNLHVSEDGYFIDANTHDYYKGASINIGTIDGAYMASTSQHNLTILGGKTNAINLYYAGTAPAPIKLKFSFGIIQDSNGYVTSIGHGDGGKLYNTITFESIHKDELHFIAPNFITSYNKVIDILLAPKDGQTYEDLRGRIRDEIRHPIIRQIIIALLNREQSNAVLTSSNYSNLLVNFKSIFDFRQSNLEPIDTNFYGVTIEIDSKTGQAIGRFTYVDIINNNDPKIIIFEENVGDMLNSNYLLLRDRNVFDDQLQVSYWMENHKDYSYRIYHDFPVPLTNVSIEYKNMYY